MFRKRYLRTSRFRINGFKLLIICIVFLLIITFVFVEKRITPTIFAIAEAKTKVMLAEAISKSVKDKIAKNVQYKDLISIHKNLNGQVTLIQVNTIEINRLESETTLEVIKTLEEVTLEYIQFPIGMVTGSKLLAEFGPNIRVALYPVGSVHVNTSETFKQAGINQTRHRVILDITAEIKIVQPLMSSNITVRTDVPITETIIIGEVPEAILDFKN